MAKDTEKKPVKKENKDKKPNVFVRIGKWFQKTFSGMWSELKKVTWPSFGTVLKNLGSVLAFVVIMLALVLVIDFGLQQGLKLIRSDSTAAAIEFIGEIL